MAVLNSPLRSPIRSPIRNGLVGGPTYVPPFLFDTFTDTDGTLITAHTGEIGATWTVQNGYAPATAPTIASNGLYAPVVPAAYYASGVPASANYCVESVLNFRSSVASDTTGPAGRITIGANTMYFCRYNVAAGGWQLQKLVTGTITQLGSTVTEAFPTGQIRTLGLLMVGDTITMRLDGADILVRTDSAITDAGRAGFRIAGAAESSTTGIHIAAISARAA